MKRLAASSLFFILLLGGCASVPTPIERRVMLDTLAHQHHLDAKTLQTALFSLFSLSDTRQCENKEMRVYIEGDGLAWKTRSLISDNPTPINPLAAKLMAIDESHCKAYIARPCQYTNSNMCENKYWTTHRFSDDVIKSYQEALQSIKKEYKNSSFSLVGYSGGAAVALLVAAKRDDIKTIITVAGNLDHKQWTDLHSLSPLDGSLNPIEYVNQLENIPQYHLIGSKDSIIPKDIFISYKNSFRNSANIHYKLYDTTHTNDWEKSYKEFLKEQNL